MKHETFEELDCGKDDGDPENKGTRIYNREQTEYGISLGRYGEQRRIQVLWKDGEKSRPHLEGIWFVDGKWKIA